MDLQRAMLDELMGAGRNLTEDERKDFKEVTWDSREVCSFYMARFCPHDLFVNTKSDLGPCARIHDPKLKESFEKSPRRDAFLAKFEGELATRCEKLVMDLDRRGRRGRERLAQGDEPMPPPPVSAEKSERLAVVEEKMRNLLVQVESLGEAGKVDEAQALMKKVDELNAEKTLLQKQSDKLLAPVSAEKSERLAVVEEKMRNLLVQVESLGEAGKVDEAQALMKKVDELNAEKTLLQKQSDKLLAVPQEKKMALCEICGSFLVANDAIERTQSHILGKQHIGYGMVRDFISEFKEAKEKAKEEEIVAREKEAEERKKQKGMEPDKRISGSGERDRYNDRDRYREPDRDRDRDRAREWNGRDSRDRRSRNGRDTTRDKYRDRSRSRSPVRRGHR